MDRQEISELEIKRLPKLAKNFVSRTEKALGFIRKSRVKLYLSEKDQYRLLTLKSWEEKYKIDLVYILQTLVPFWEKFVQRRSKKMKREGFNCRVSTLTGKKSEQILRDRIQQDFPHGENYTLWIASKRERIILSHMQTERLKTVGDFGSPERFVNYYRRYMHEELELRDRIIAQMKRKNFRNNPFRPETCR